MNICRGGSGYFCGPRRRYICWAVSMKTLLITSFHAHISRNILGTDTLSILAARNDLSVVIVVPDYKKSYFEERFARPRVVIAGVPHYLASRAISGLVFKRLARAMLPTGTVRFKRRYKFYWDRKLLYFVASYLAGILSRSFLAQRLARYLDFRLASPGIFFRLLKDCKPDAVFATDLHDENDVALIQDARRLGIPVIGMWRSWDNPTQQLLRMAPDRFLMGSKQLEEETAALHRYPPASMAAVGHPHYDRYRRGPGRSRSEFCAQWGLDPEKKIILYAAGGDKIIRLNDLDQYVMEILGTVDANVIVRYPPGEDVRLVDFRQPSNMVIDRPGLRFAARPGELEIRPEDDANLRDELSWSDVVISGPTSVLLDGMFFDKPVIAVDCYPARRNAYRRSWGYPLDHIRKLLATGGVRHARSRDEFMHELGAYLANPGRDAPGRAAARGRWFSYADGNASQRLAAELLKFIGLE